MEPGQARGERLLPATEMSSRLVLWPLWHILLVASDTLRGVPGLLRFPREILLWAALVVFIVQSQHPLRAGQEACGPE